MPRLDAQQRSVLRSRIKGHFGDNTAAYFDRTPDPGYLKALQSEAEAFQIGTRTVKLSIDDEFAIDFGGSEFNESLILAPIPLTDNKDLSNLLTHSLRGAIAPDDAYAVLVDYRVRDDLWSKRIGHEVFLRRQSVIAQTTSDVGGGESFATFHRLDESGLATLFTGNVENVQDVEEVSRIVDSILPPIAERPASQTGRVISVDAGSLQVTEIERMSVFKTDAAPTKSVGALGTPFLEIYRRKDPVSGRLRRSTLDTFKDVALMRMHAPRAPLGSPVSGVPGLQPIYIPASRTKSAVALSGALAIGAIVQPETQPETATAPPPTRYGPPDLGGAYSHICNCETESALCIGCCIKSFGTDLAEAGTVLATAKSVCPAMAAVPLIGPALVLACYATAGVIAGVIMALASVQMGQCMDNCTKVATNCSG
jgi:hypothetical protein